MSDVSEEITKRARKRIEEGVRSSGFINGILKRIEGGSLNYNEPAKLANEVGKIVSKALEAELVPSNLPDGKLYYNIAIDVLEEVLGESHGIVVDATALLQQNINSNLGIGIKPIKPKLNESRVRNIASKIAENAFGYDSFEQQDFLIGKDVMENFHRSIVNDSISENAEFMSEAGLVSYIERIDGNNCCAWCASMAGRYVYGEQPDDFFRMHDNCTCEILFMPARNEWKRITFSNGTKVTERL